MGLRHRWLAATVLVIAAALTACDSNPPPQSSQSSAPANTSPPSSTSARPPLLAPQITQPLDATRFYGDPCQSLTEVQRQTIGLDSGSIDQSSKQKGNPGCVYSIADRHVRVTLTYNANTLTRIGEQTYGLSSVYEQQTTGIWEHREPIELDGYPAVIYEVTPSKAQIVCQAAVGLSDSSFFDVRYVFQLADPKEGDSPCAAARTIAAGILSTIKAAA